MFKPIYSITNLRVWIKPITHKKSVYLGRACLNLFRTGNGFKVNYIFTNKQGVRLKFDLPLSALNNLVEVLKECGWQKRYDKTKYKVIDWRKKNVTEEG